VESGPIVNGADRRVIQLDKILTRARLKPDGLTTLRARIENRGSPRPARALEEAVVSPFHACFAFAALAAVSGCQAFGARSGGPLLFTEDGAPQGWTVRAWNDVKDPPPDGAAWRVENGVLHGSEPRGTWLVSEKEYGDFLLAFEWKLGERGNSGCGLRFPMAGDPAFDGLELQMVDPRYYPPEQSVTPGELTGSLYKAVAPKAQVYRPTAWNQYVVTCNGPHVVVMLNGAKVLDVDLDAQTSPTKRHDGTDAPPLKDRPRRGHIGFQELSRGGGHVEIRNVRLEVLD
jgi:hypothetical protein